MASTKDRQRALERARYERVQAKMQAKKRAARRKTRLAVVSSIAAVVVIGGVGPNARQRAFTVCARRPRTQCTGRSRAAPKAARPLLRVR